MQFVSRTVFHNNEGTSDKVYIIDVYGDDGNENGSPTKVITHWGKREAKIFSSQTREFSTRVQARKHLEKIVGAKERDGYNEKQLDGKKKITIPHIPSIDIPALTSSIDTTKKDNSNVEEFRNIEL